MLTSTVPFGNVFRSSRRIARFSFSKLMQEIWSNATRRPGGTRVTKVAGFP